MIRISICDDHPLVREGFKHIRSEVSDMTVVAEAVSGREAVGEILSQGLSHDATVAPHTELPDREFQIFLRLANDESSSDISTALSLSGKTISTCRSRLIEKMKMRSNSELTYYALKNDLVK